jgi:hypothetical protein
MSLFATAHDLRDVIWNLYSVNDGAVELNAMKQKKKAPCAKGQLITSAEAIQLSEDKEAKKKEDNEKTEENRRVRVRNKTQKWTRAIDEIFSMYQKMETRWVLHCTIELIAVFQRMHYMRKSTHLMLECL